MMKHSIPYSTDEKQEVWQERQDVWQEMCTNWQIEQIIYTYIADAYHRTEQRARKRAIDVEMEVNDYCVGGGAFGTWPLNNGNHPLISCTIGYMVHIYLM
mgnify:CR=1 FL=1